MKSILQSEKECYICGARRFLHLHHVYFGKNRKVSDDNGFTVWLCEAHHTGYAGVHGNAGEYLNRKLKEECQSKYEETHSREEFRSLIGRSYL